MSCDSQVTYRHHKNTDKTNHTYSNELSKIKQANDMLIWWAGSWNWLLFMSRYMEAHKPASATIWWVEEFIMWFYEWAKKKDKNYNNMNAFIIVFGKKIFVVRYYNVQEVDNYTAIWSWTEYAITAMYLWKDTKKAVDVAKEFDLYCSGETLTFTC